MFKLFLGFGAKNVFFRHTLMDSVVLWSCHPPLPWSRIGATMEDSWPAGSPESSSLSTCSGPGIWSSPAWWPAWVPPSSSWPSRARRSSGSTSAQVSSADASCWPARIKNPWKPSGNKRDQWWLIWNLYDETGLSYCSLPLTPPYAGHVLTWQISRNDGLAYLHFIGLNLSCHKSKPFFPPWARLYEYFQAGAGLQFRLHSHECKIFVLAGLLGYFISWQFGACYSWIAQKGDITGRVAPLFLIGCGTGGVIFPPTSGFVFT